MKNKRICILLLVCIGFFPLFSENKQDEETEESTEIEISAPVGQIVFPEENLNLLFIEGESAVSTNFNQEPTLNYGSSGFRTLQLSRYTELAGGAHFFAEYLFYVEEPGEYEFWYGGTPPGPREDFFPSYTSPFSLTIDGGEKQVVYRENIVVTEEYIPTFYWNKGDTYNLSRGLHTFRFEVSEKRRFDGKYLFYLDAFFLVQPKAKDGLAEQVPEPVFPQSLSPPYDDIQFKSISEYQALLDESEDTTPYEQLSLIYSLTGDYINALRTLRKANLLNPDALYTYLLSAKNRIWKGNVAEGLEEYRKLLSIDPKALDVWLEAGKVAAWTGKYKESVNFFLSGIKQFPNDLSLHVNLALTYLWASKLEEAENYFARAEKIASGDVELIKQLGEILVVNGYPQKAVEIYTRTAKQYPEYLELYMKLGETYTHMGREKDAEEMMARVEKVFPPSEKLTRILGTYRKRQGLRQKHIDGFIQKLEENPDNLELRQQLVQTYYWNGLRDEAIEEYKNILTNYAYRQLLSVEMKSFDLLETADRFYIYDRYFDELPGRVVKEKKNLSEALAKHTSARNEFDKLNKKAEEAAAKGEAWEGIVPEEVRAGLAEAEDGLAAALEAAVGVTLKAEEMIISYENDKRQLNTVLEKEAEIKENFAKLTAPIRWKWDRAGSIQEMEEVSRLGGTFADYVLGRINLFDSRFEEALPRLEKAAAAIRSPAAEYAFIEAGFWSGRIETDSLSVMLEAPELSGYAPHVAGYLPLLEEAVDGEEGLGIYLDTTADEARDKLSGLDAASKEAGAASKELDRILKVLHELLMRKLERAFFNYEQETYLIRFELGDYYLGENRLAEATRQFEQVLRVDPWNTTALYKLGVVRQRYGDWKGAMRYYKRVYETDPGYQNVTQYNNLLARAHADTLSFSTNTEADTQKIAFHGEASFLTNIASSFGLNIKYEADAKRTYTTFDVPGLTDDEQEDPSMYLVHTLSASVPFSLFQNRLNITPSAGLSLFSGLYDNTVPDITDTLGAFFSTHTVFPDLEATVTASFDPVYASAYYRFGRYPETYNPEKQDFNSHTWEGLFQLTFSFLDVPVIRGTSLRSYGKLHYLTSAALGETNLIGTAAQNLTVGIHLFDTPWTTLLVTGDVIYEGSQKEELRNYYTPVDVLIGKGGLGGSTWITLANGNVLGIYLAMNAGAYIEELGSADMTTSVQLEGLTRFDLQKGDSTYYFALQGSGTSDDSFNTTSYWSLYATLGISAKVVKLLAD